MRMVKLYLLVKRVSCAPEAMGPCWLIGMNQRRHKMSSLQTAGIIQGEYTHRIRHMNGTITNGPYRSSPPPQPSRLLAGPIRVHGQIRPRRIFFHSKHCIFIYLFFSCCLSMYCLWSSVWETGSWVWNKDFCIELHQDASWYQTLTWKVIVSECKLVPNINMKGHCIKVQAGIKN